MCSSGGERLRSAVTRGLARAADGAADHRRRGRRMLAARHLGRRRLPVGLEPGGVARHGGEHLAAAVAERDPHVGRIQHRAHQDLEVLRLQGGDGGAGEGAVRRHDRPRRTRSCSGRARSCTAGRRAAWPGSAPPSACGSSRGRRSRGRAGRRRCDATTVPSASSTTIERTPGMASLSTLRRAESRRRALVRRQGDEVVAHARQGAVDAVELLADVLVDDAGLGVQPVALGVVGRPMRLQKGVADDRADDDEGDRERDPFHEEGRAGSRCCRRRRLAGLDPRVAEDARLERGRDRVGAHRWRAGGSAPAVLETRDIESVFGSAARK